MRKGPGKDFRYKKEILAAVRAVGLMGLADRLYGEKRVEEEAEANEAYLKAHPDLILPPPELAQRTYGTPSLRHFHEWGCSNAQEIEAVLGRHIDLGSAKIAEWGCGLGRIARHLVGRYDYTGFDIDQPSISWCWDNLAGTYHLNQPDPPLSADDETFDAVFAVSIFTHLSEKSHRAWRDEILRVLKPGGIFAFTVHGEGEAQSLSSSEREAFGRGELVVRGRVKEGSRTYLAFHPQAYVEDVMLDGFDHVEGPEEACAQTMYVGRKRAEA